MATIRQPAPISELEVVLDYKFQKQTLLTTALTHPSSVSPTNYEMLEFLGDRVLGLLVAKTLFKQYPVQAQLGKMAICYNKSVCTATLADIANKINLGKYFTVGNGEITITNQILADGCEALIAALYLDGGFTAAEKFFNRYWNLTDSFFSSVKKDPKSRLQEWAQKSKLELPKYTAVELENKTVPHFKVKLLVNNYPPVFAIAKSKQEGQQLAAEDFINRYTK